MKLERFTGKALLAFFLCILAGRVAAQQTYFNVPSSDIVDKHAFAAQQQVNFGESFRSTTTLDYGLGREWEIGLNLYNVEYEPQIKQFIRNDSSTQKPFGPLLLLNTQKAFDINEHLEVAIGGQGGLNLTPDRQSKLVGYLYTHIAGSLQEEHYNWSFGAYTANPRYLGEGSKAGFQAGFDAGIFYQKFHLLGDWISGSHDFGQLVLGAEVYLGKHLPLAIGWQRANRDGAQALVVQLTYTPE